MELTSLNCNCVLEKREKCDSVVTDHGERAEDIPFYQAVCELCVHNSQPQGLAVTKEIPMCGFKKAFAKYLLGIKGGYEINLFTYIKNALYF